MGRKRKEELGKSPISRDSVHTIVAILSLVVSVFLLLGAFGAAGKVGTGIFEISSYFFGVGYYVLPIVFLLLSISLIHDRESGLAFPQILGSFTLLISSLGFIDLSSDKGGVVGALISEPLISLFDVYISMVLLVSLGAISFIIIFDVPLKFNLNDVFTRLFSKRDGVQSAEDTDRVVTKALGKIESLPDELVRRPESKPMKSEEESFAPLMRMKSGKTWTPPPLSLLERDSGKPGVGDIKANANLIKRTFLNFGIMVEMDEISIGPSVTRYALKPAEGVKLSKIIGLQNNLELALAAHPVRIEAPIPGKSLVGIEVPNSAKTTIGLGSLLSEEGFTNSEQPLLVALGKDITGASIFSNIAKMPHLLIAGATGSGKSVTIHALITSLLYRTPPENLKFIMIDPKRVELTLYNGIPHLLTPVITEPKKAILSLKWLAKEMDRRYDLLEKSSARDVYSYQRNVIAPAIENSKLKIGNSETPSPEPMPYIVIVIDELADLMQTYPRELEAGIVRLAQMSRAVGIHLILSTQRPSVNVITGLIKANIPSRVALQVVSQIDSRTILDAPGAEKLLGAGDMLFQSGEMSKPVRLQSAYIREAEVKSVVKYFKDSYQDELQDEINFSTDKALAPDAIFSASIGRDDSNDLDDDELYEEARATVIQAGKASTSFLQRKLRIGYARAARLMDMLEERGVVAAGSGAKPREVIGVEGVAGVMDEEEIANETNEAK